MNRTASFLFLLALCCASVPAISDPIVDDPLFTFTFAIGPNTGLGGLNTVDNGGGSSLAIGGSMTVTGGPNIGPYVLGPGGPVFTTR